MVFVIISRGAEGPGREILQRPPSVCLSVCPSVRANIHELGAFSKSLGTPQFLYSFTEWI